MDVSGKGWDQRAGSYLELGIELLPDCQCHIHDWGIGFRSVQSRGCVQSVEREAYPEWVFSIRAHDIGETF